MGQAGSAERDEEVRRQTTEEVKAELREDEAHKPLVLKKADIVVNRNPYPDPISGLSQRSMQPSFYGGNMMGMAPPVYGGGYPQQRYMPPQQEYDPYQYRYGRPDQIAMRQQIRADQKRNIFHQYATPAEKFYVKTQQYHAPTYKSQMMYGPQEPKRSERLLSYLGVPGGKL